MKYLLAIISQLTNEALVSLCKIPWEEPRQNMTGVN